ncbi:hypothetical protein H0H93_007699 [Arthromyces matolae]|nr:hypothetical protein H0H93_007699 [Arthromyces matolae]
MSVQEVTPFSGGDGTNDENGHDFLRSYEQAMAKESDEHKLVHFRNYLRPQSIADNWYEDINKGVQTSWKELRKAFSERWLSEETSPASILEKTKAVEYEREILESRDQVDSGDVGK